MEGVLMLKRIATAAIISLLMTSTMTAHSFAENETLISQNNRNNSLEQSFSATSQIEYERQRNAEAAWLQFQEHITRAVAVQAQPGTDVARHRLPLPPFDPGILPLPTKNPQPGPVADSEREAIAGYFGISPDQIESFRLEPIRSGDGFFLNHRALYVQLKNGNSYVGEMNFHPGFLVLERPIYLESRESIGVQTHHMVGEYPIDTIYLYDSYSVVWMVQSSEGYQTTKNIAKALGVNPWDLSRISSGFSIYDAVGKVWRTGPDRYNEVVVELKNGLSFDVRLDMGRYYHYDRPIEVIFWDDAVTIPLPGPDDDFVIRIPTDELGFMIYTVDSFKDSRINSGMEALILEQLLGVDKSQIASIRLGNRNYVLGELMALEVVLKNGEHYVGEIKAEEIQLVRGGVSSRTVAYELSLVRVPPGVGIAALRGIADVLGVTIQDIAAVDRLFLWDYFQRSMVGEECYRSSPFQVLVQLRHGEAQIVTLFPLYPSFSGDLDELGYSYYLIGYSYRQTRPILY